MDSKDGGVSHMRAESIVLATSGHRDIGVSGYRGIEVSRYRDNRISGFSGYRGWQGWQGWRVWRSWQGWESWEDMRSCESWRLELEVRVHQPRRSSPDAQVISPAEVELPVRGHVARREVMLLVR